MAVVKCKECGGLVSSSAKLCPHCGYNLANDKARRGCATLLVICLIGFAAVQIGDYFSKPAAVQADVSSPTPMPISGAESSSLAKPTEDTSRMSNEASNNTTNDTEDTSRVEAPPQNWQYSESVDNMRGQISKYAVVTSNEELDFKSPYDGGTSVTLTLTQNSKGNNEAFFRIQNEKGQFICGYQGCSIVLKFDDGPLMHFHGLEPGDGSTTALILYPYQLFLQKLRKARVLSMETTYFEEGEQQVTFDVAGLNWK